MHAVSSYTCALPSCCIRQQVLLPLTDLAAVSSNRAAHWSCCGCPGTAFGIPAVLAELAEQGAQLSHHQGLPHGSAECFGRAHSHRGEPRPGREVMWPFAAFQKAQQGVLSTLFCSLLSILNLPLAGKTTPESSQKLKSETSKAAAERYCYCSSSSMLYSPQVLVALYHDRLYLTHLTYSTYFGRRVQTRASLPGSIQPCDYPGLVLFLYAFRAKVSTPSRWSMGIDDSVHNKHQVGSFDVTCLQLIDVICWLTRLAPPSKPFRAQMRQLE